MTGEVAATPPRLLPGRPLPAYAYVPGRFPHPVRDPGGHSFGQPEVVVTDPALDAPEVLWGFDLFNAGYYWEAHEAWEPFWRAAGRDDPRRALLKGLILLAAAGVKVRQGKPAATRRHAQKAAALFRAAAAPDVLAGYAERAATRLGATPETRERPKPVFDFVLRPAGCV